MNAPRLIVVPAWLALLAFTVLVGAVVVASECIATTKLASRNLVACESRAQANLVAATACDSHLTTCLGSVRRIADELEIEGVVY